MYYPASWIPLLHSSMDSLEMGGFMSSGGDPGASVGATRDAEPENPRYVSHTYVYIYICMYRCI